MTMTIEEFILLIHGEHHDRVLNLQWKVKELWLHTRKMIRTIKRIEWDFSNRYQNMGWRGF